MNDEQLQVAANVFSSDETQQCDIQSAGNKAMSILYDAMTARQEVRHFVIEC